jgi:hypothetical protein
LGSRHDPTSMRCTHRRSDTPAFSGRTVKAAAKSRPLVRRLNRSVSSSLRSAAVVPRAAAFSPAARSNLAAASRRVRSRIPARPGSIVPTNPSVPANAGPVVPIDRGVLPPPRTCALSCARRQSRSLPRASPRHARRVDVEATIAQHRPQAQRPCGRTRIPGSVAHRCIRVSTVPRQARSLPAFKSGANAATGAGDPRRPSHGSLAGGVRERLSAALADDPTPRRLRLARFGP